MKEKNPAAVALGKLGGAALRDKRGTEFFKEIGRKGGLKVRDNQGPEFFSRIGKKGAQKMLANKKGIVP